MCKVLCKLFITAQLSLLHFLSPNWTQSEIIWAGLPHFQTVLQDLFSSYHTSSFWVYAWKCKHSSKILPTKTVFLMTFPMRGVGSRIKLTWEKQNFFKSIRRQRGKRHRMFQRTITTSICNHTDEIKTFNWLSTSQRRLGSAFSCHSRKLITTFCL